VFTKTVYTQRVTIELEQFNDFLFLGKRTQPKNRKCAHDLMT